MLCKIVKEHDPDYYLDEIVGEMINKPGKDFKNLKVYLYKLLEDV